MSNAKKPVAIAIEEWAHSPLGPSASERWMECPGSVLATKDMKDKPSQYATEGTAAHTVTEWCREYDVRGEHYIGTVIEVPEGDQNFYILVDQEMADAVNYFLDYVETFHGDIYIEEKVSYEAWVAGGFGTSDDMRVTDTRVVVTDFKYGKGIQVYAHENTQLKMYALGFLHDYGWMYPDLKDFQLNICQPRLDHIDEFVISLNDLLVWADDEVRPKAIIAMQPGAPFAAGKWCQFCLIKNDCRERARSVYEATVGDFEDLDETTPIEAIDPARLALDEIGLMIPFLPTIKAFCSDLESHALSEIAKGNVIVHPVTGEYKIVEGCSNRCYKSIAEEGQDNDEAIIERFKRQRVPASKYLSKKLNTLPAMEKILGKKHPLIVELQYKPPGKPKLVPGTDKRPAITIDPEEEFEDLGEEGLDI